MAFGFGPPCEGLWKQFVAIVRKLRTACDKNSRQLGNGTSSDCSLVAMTTSDGYNAVGCVVDANDDHWLDLSPTR
jgi:hypothetical protein